MANSDLPLRPANQAGQYSTVADREKGPGITGRIAHRLAEWSPMPAHSRGLLAQTPGPGLIEPPGPYLDWVSLLPPRPVPAPKTAARCSQRVDYSRVDGALAEMRRRHNQLTNECRHEAVFAMAYLRVSEKLLEALRAGVFNDEAWVIEEMSVFADMYFRIFDVWEEGDDENVPGCWQIALNAARDNEISGLGNFVLSMNAHVNRDMAYAIESVGLVDEHGRSRKPDHDAFNRQLATLFSPVINEIAYRFDPTANDRGVGRKYLTGVTVLQAWRQGVWRNAERLALARTQRERERIEERIDAFAARQARLYHRVFKYRSDEARKARELFAMAAAGPTVNPTAARARISNGQVKIDGDAPETRPQLPNTVPIGSGETPSASMSASPREATAENPIN